MDIKNLKDYIYQNPKKIEELLDAIGCHHIKLNRGSGDDYYTYANPDGDNRSANTTYVSPSLLTISYTRDICTDKNSCDLIDYIRFYRSGENFFQTLKWISDKVGLDYYHNFDSDMPESLKILKVLEELFKKENSKEDDTPIKPISEKVLTYYRNTLSEMFYEDGIDWKTQREFEIGYDDFSSRFTLPIRDEMGVLVGVKARYFYREVPENELKYFYLEPCPRGKILYGYYKTYPYIQQSDKVYVVESEKGCQQFWAYGIKNVVSTGGTKLAQTQIDKLSRLGKKIVLVFDKDFTEEKIQNLREKFLEQIEFYAVIDKENILGEKESPSDNKEKLIRLLEKNVYKIESEVL